MAQQFTFVSLLADESGYVVKIEAGDTTLTLGHLTMLDAVHLVPFLKATSVFINSGSDTQDAALQLMLAGLGVRASTLNSPVNEPSMTGKKRGRKPRNPDAPVDAPVQSAD